MGAWRARLLSWARRLKRDVLTLWIAARSPRTPRIAKLISAGVVAYALSPLDLIPDFIPIFGYLDDVLLVPLGIALAMRLIPPPLIAEFRVAADARIAVPVSRYTPVVIVAIWCIGMVAAVQWATRHGR